MSKQPHARRRLASKVFVGIHLAIVILPLLLVAVWAFTDRWAWPSLLPEATSFRGIELVLSGSSNTGLPVLLRTIGIAFAVALLSTAVAGLACRAVARYEWAGRELFNFSLVLPYLVPATVFAMGVQVIFLRMGIGSTYTGVILAHTIVALPYCCTIMVEVTKAAGPRLEEAAASLGADIWSRLRYVIIPQLTPGILSSISMAYILSFSQYFLTLLIGGGKIKTFTLVMFPYLTGGDRTIACAYGLAFLVVTFVVFFVFEILLKRLGMEENSEMLDF